MKRLALVAIWCASCGDSPTGMGASDGCTEAYSPQETSPYVLPCPRGSSFVVGQGNCSDFSHTPDSLVRYAYDLMMPLGSPIVAARAGTVLLVEERFTGGNRTAGQENFVNVAHEDGTIAGQVHLTQNGALVSVGERVAQAEVIGLSGDTGASTEPQLHFHVQRCDGCATIPVTFRNTRPHPHGLVVGEVYLAE